MLSFISSLFLVGCCSTTLFASATSSTVHTTTSSSDSETTCGGVRSSTSSSSSSTCDAGPFRIDPSTGVFLDTCGRERYFRGFNSVNKGFPFVYDPHVFTPGGRSLSPADAALWQSMGLNVVRLGVLWSGVVPTKRGEVNQTYLSVLVNLTQCLYEEAGIFTFLDSHQDTFSATFCDDGAPAWVAIEYSQRTPSPFLPNETFPAPVFPSFPMDNTTGGPNTSYCGISGVSWSDYYLTYSVGLAFQTLYTSEKGIQDYSDFWSAITVAYGTGVGGSPGLLAFEILNEPWSGDALSDILLMIPGVADKVNLQPFYYNISASIRAAETSIGAVARPLFYEPVTWDNFIPAGFTSLPDAEAGLAGLSYHYYSLPDIIGSAWQIEARDADAKRLHTGALLTEFDVDLVSPVNSPYTNLDLRATLDACDFYGHGYIGWAWESLWNYANNTLVYETVVEMSRPWPFAIAGTNATWSFNATNEAAPVFRMNYLHNTSLVVVETGKGGAAVAASAPPTIVYLSTGIWFPVKKINIVVTTAPPIPDAISWVLETYEGKEEFVAVQQETRSEGNDNESDATIGSSSSSAVVPPTPWAYAYLVITTGNGTALPASLNVSVEVSCQ